MASCEIESFYTLAMAAHKEDPKHIKKRHTYQWRTSLSAPWMNKEAKDVHTPML
jgi:hypothetical protein